MKGKLLGEVAVQFDRLQRQQQRRPVPGSSASRLPPPPLPPGSRLPPAHLLLPLPARGRREATGRHRRSILAAVSEGPWAASPPRTAAA